jgi:hypothetical protein
MKRTFSVLFALCLALLTVACGNGTPPEITPTTSVAASGPTTSATSVAPEGAYDVNELLAPLAEAASLGDTINMTMLDITASGNIREEDIVTFAGVQSINYADNGGTVIVVQTVPGAADRVATGFVGYRDGVLSQAENYKADYPIAYENMTNARIVQNGDYVVFAVSATGNDGGYDTLDTALEAAFA